MCRVLEAVRVEVQPRRSPGRRGGRAGLRVFWPNRMSADPASLADRIAALEARNRARDLDKQWERSWLRFAIVCALTYGCLALYMWAARLEPALLNAVVPTAGYALSTATFPALRRAGD